MRIRKIAESVGVLGKILNSKSNSKGNTYSSDYIEKNFLGGGGRIVKETFTLQSNSAGNAGPFLENSNKRIVISAYDTRGDNIMILPYTFNNNWYVTVVNYKMALQINKQIVINVVYIDYT